MKSLFLTGLFVAASFTAAVAQAAERPGDPTKLAASATELTRQMNSRLHLQEAQFIRLRALNQKKLTRLDEISWQAPDEATRRVQIAELEAQYEAECSRILTPSQLSIWHDDRNPNATPTEAKTKEGGLG